MHEERPEQTAADAHQHKDWDLPHVPVELAREVRLVVSVEPKVAVRAKVRPKKRGRVVLNLVQKVEREHARARREEGAPEHLGRVEGAALLDGEEHPADRSGEGDGDARCGADRDEVSLVHVVAQAREAAPRRAQPERDGAHLPNPATNEPAAVHERALLAGDQPRGNRKRYPAKLCHERAEPEEAWDVHAVEIRLELRDTGTRCERLDVAHEPARNCCQRQRKGDQRKKGAADVRIAFYKHQRRV
mmetsp:Transcript_4057/g.14183  ORF Transcript_4057/g.14183 Transcript_4057/m.14183 type:complete len:246 (+) Transcript_4057:1629-2366(+)